MVYWLVRFIVALVLSVFAIEAIAKDTEYRLLVGSSLTTFNSTMRLESETFGTQESIDFEDDLKFDRQVNLFLLKLESRFATNHQLSFSYLPLHRSAFAASSDSFTYQQDTVAWGSQVHSAFNVNAIDVEYAYRMFDHHRFNLDLIGGVYWMQTELSLSVQGEIRMNDNEYEATASYQNKSTSRAPLPLFGIASEFHLNDRWKASASFRYFKSSHHADEGEIVASIIATEYDLNDKWGIGASYSFFDAGIFIEDSVLDFDSEIRWKYHGANVYAYYRF